MIEKRSPAPAATGHGTVQISNTNSDRDPSLIRQEVDEITDKLELLADWWDDLQVRIDRRQEYVERVNAWAGHDDLKMEVRDFCAACCGLVGQFSTKRRMQ